MVWLALFAVIPPPPPHSRGGGWNNRGGAIRGGQGLGLWDVRKSRVRVVKGQKHDYFMYQLLHTISIDTQRVIHYHIPS